jgi:hypothetical protein
VLGLLDYRICLSSKHSYDEHVRIFQVIFEDLDDTQFTIYCFTATLLFIVHDSKSNNASDFGAVSCQAQ